VAANEKIFIGPGEGAHLPVLDITHKIKAESFGGAFTIIEVSLAPGEMIPPHTHTHEDE
jgi:quercetin dioxygenase-like cupin family protein